MKRIIIELFVVVIGFSLMAFNYLSFSKTSCVVSDFPVKFDTSEKYNFLSHLTVMNPEELLYKIDTRFIANIKKSDLDNAKTIIDILPKKATEGIDSYSSSRISLLDDHVETDRRAYSDNEVLSKSQIQLIQSTNATDNIYIRSDYSMKDFSQIGMQSNYLTYFISVVPDQVAVYEDGYNSLIQYLREGSKEEASIISKEGLKPGKVRFTVGKDGLVSNVKLTSTSGYETVDMVLVKLIENMPGVWKPAANIDGDAIDQELVFFFGLEGC